LDYASEDENFLKRIITGDETWVYGYDVETKMQCSQWVGKNFPRLKKAWQVRPNVKGKVTLLLVVFSLLLVSH
jgi:hypothetical protein